MPGFYVLILRTTSNIFAKYIKGKKEKKKLAHEENKIWSNSSIDYSLMAMRMYTIR
jgi:hypothetical protein